MSISIFERDKIAKLKYKKYINNLENMKKNRDTVNNYIDIIELLFYNDTNKDIVKLYLRFLKNNSGFVKNYDLNSYEKEKQKFKRLFSIEEMDDIEKNIKTISEKQNLINFLKKMSNTKNND